MQKCGPTEFVALQHGFAVGYLDNFRVSADDPLVQGLGTAPRRQMGNMSPGMSAAVNSRGKNR
jgi:hypothetical protein